MSVISTKEDISKANITMEEGDSSLEPGEVKTPPHGVENTKSKEGEEKTKLKNNTSQYLPLAKSASKQETDKCAEKVRAILELDAIKRREEIERKKEQKSEPPLDQHPTKKKDHRKRKTSTSNTRESKDVDLRKYETKNAPEGGIKKTKHKKSKRSELKSYHKKSADESCESMQTIGSAVSLPMISPMNFVTPLSNISKKISGRFSDLNNSTSYRTYNPFMRNYHTDFRHRKDNFVSHSRTRFPRYHRSQYISSPFHAQTEESSQLHPPQCGIPHSQLLWTKTKPSISYAFTSHEGDAIKISKNSTEQNVPKKKKNKKSKEREGSNRSLSSGKISHKSSKRKKIRKIREALQLPPAKNQLLSSSDGSFALGTFEGENTPEHLNSTSDSTKQSADILAEDDCATPERPESKKEVSKSMDKVAGEKAKSQILDMFASLTPPKQKSPRFGVNSNLSTSSNVQITNKFQEIQDRIDKLLEDDELKLESIQATKEKLLQKSREHTENMNASKSSSKKQKDTNSTEGINSNISKSNDNKFEKNVKHNSKDRYKSICKSSDDLRFKEKTPIDIFSDAKNDERKHAKDECKIIPTKSLHSKTPPSVPHTVKFQKDRISKSPREKYSKKKSLKSKNLSLEDSPSNFINSAKSTIDGSPDTDDYSDNWENDDEEIDISSAFKNLNQLGSSKKLAVVKITGSSRSPSMADSVDSDSNSRFQSTTPKNSPPQQCLSLKLNCSPKESPYAKVECQETDEMQRLYNQFIESVENAAINLTEEPCENSSILEIKKEKENETEQLSTSSTSYSSSSSSSSDTSISSSGSSSSTSSSDSASDDSNDVDMLKKEDLNTASNDESARETTSSRTLTEKEKTLNLLTTTDDVKPNVTKDLKKLESLEANLLRIQMMRANYDSADEISDELLKMEKLFLHEKNIILNKFMESSMSKPTKKESESSSEFHTPMQLSTESLQSASLSKGQFVQSLQKLPNKCDESHVTNIFDTNREVIKLTISPVKLPKTSAIFEADNDMDISKHIIETGDKSDSTVKPPKPIKEVAIVKPIMESKELPSAHHHKRRRSPLPTHHTIQSRPRSRRGRVRSLSVSPSRNRSERCATPQKRNWFSKSSRLRNYERRSRSRSRSTSVTRSLSRRSGDTSPVPRKRRSLINVDDRFRKHSPRRESRSRSRSRSPSSPAPRHRCDRYSRSPLPFKPPSPPTDPNSSPIVTHRSSLSPFRRLRSNSRSPNKRTVTPPKSYDSNRHRSLSPKHRVYKQHSPHQSNTSYYFNHSPNRISLDARINIVLNGPSSSHNENNTSIPTYDDYSHYGQYGPAAYMALPSDSNSFYTNQYVPMVNTGATATVPPAHGMQHTFSNIPTGASEESELFTPVPHHSNVNATNFYYNRFGTQPFGLNQSTSVLKELPKATVAVQKGNVLEIVPCGDLLGGNLSDHTNGNENHNKKVDSNQDTTAEPTNPNCEKGKRSILKPLDGENNSLGSVSVGAPKKKKVNFEDGVFPNHNSDDEDRKVIEARMRVKMRRLRKKLGITPPCYNLFQDKARKERQRANFDKRAPPPPPSGLAPPNLEQPIYLRTHTPTPLLYFHFDGAVHSMYVSQMERPIPPRLLNPKCLSATNISVVSQHTDTQSPLYMQSPISAGVPHLHTSKKDPIATFTRPNRTENISPKVIVPTALQQAAGSPKLNFKMYSPIESIHQSDIGNITLPSTSPNSIKGNTIHTITTAAIPNHLLPKRQESPKDSINTRGNMSMGLLPVPITHPPMPVQNTVVPPHTRIPVIGVPPNVNPAVIPSISEPFMGGGFTPAMIQTPHHPMNNPNQNYMVPPSIAHPINPHMALSHPINTHMAGGVQQYYNSPVQRMNRPLPNYMVPQAQQSPTPSNLPLCNLVDPMEAANADLDKFSNPQNMAIPFNFQGP